MKKRMASLALTIADDGVGMAHRSSDGTGMGLRIMRYRASLIRGSLSIDGPQEGGTRVSCLVTKEKADGQA